MAKKKVKKMLFIEGTSNKSNGDLSQGFHKLLSQKLAGTMPRIVMGNNKPDSIRKFKNSGQLAEKSYLLIDSDCPADNCEQDLKDHNLVEDKELVFYMIQEMEAWFISQPTVLDDFYNHLISERLTQRAPKEVPDPVQELIRVTKDTRKGRYRKVQHGTFLLEMLDATQLEQDFENFAQLIQKIKSD